MLADESFMRDLEVLILFHPDWKIKSRFPEECVLDFGTLQFVYKEVSFNCALVNRTFIYLIDRDSDADSSKEIPIYEEGEWLIEGPWCNKVPQFVQNEIKKHSLREKLIEEEEKDSFYRNNAISGRKLDALRNVFNNYTKEVGLPSEFSVNWSNDDLCLYVDELVLRHKDTYRSESMFWYLSIGPLVFTIPAPSSNLSTYRKISVSIKNDNESLDVFSEGQWKVQGPWVKDIPKLVSYYLEKISQEEKEEKERKLREKQRVCTDIFESWLRERSDT